MNWTVLIIEDEALAAQKLLRQIGGIAPDIQVLGITTSVSETKNFLIEKTPDLVLSDIQLSDGLSFSIFEEEKQNLPVIFTTAYNQYALEAFKSFSIDYLLKPVSNKALLQALEKFDRVQNLKRSPIDYQALMQVFSPRVYKDRFLVQLGGGRLKSIPTVEISYFFAEGKHTMLVTQDGRRYLSERNLSKVLEDLDPSLFFQVNRNYLVCINSIVDMFHYSKSRIKIELNPPAEKEVVVSVERSPAFKKWLGK